MWLIHEGGLYTVNYGRSIYTIQIYKYTLLHCDEEEKTPNSATYTHTQSKQKSNASENKCIFNKTLKTATDEAFVMSSGRLFQSISRQ